MFLTLRMLARHGRTAGLLTWVTAAAEPGAAGAPGASQPVTTIIAWGKWGVLVCGVAGLLVRPARWPSVTGTGPPSLLTARPGCPGSWVA